MKLLLVLLLLAAISYAQQPAANQQSINSIHQKSGDSSVNVAGVQGNVTVQILRCTGVPAKALRTLEKKYAEEINRGSLEQSRLQKELEDWRNRYIELTDRLTSSQISGGLSARAKDLLEAGELDKAREILEKASVGDEKDVDRAAEDHYRLAQVYWLQFQPQRALENQETAYRYRPGVAYGIDYMMMLQQENRLAEAEAVGLDVLKKARSLDSGDRQRVNGLPALLNNLGVLYKNTARFGEAEKAFAEVVQLERHVSNESPQYPEALASALDNLGQVHVATAHYSDAAVEFAESISIFEELDHKYNNDYDLQLACVFSNYGVQYFLLQDYQRAQEFLGKALRIEQHRGVAGGRGSPNTLGNLGLVYQAKCDFDGAERSALEVTAIFRQWAESDADGADSHLAISLKNLGILYLTIDKSEQADKALTEADAIYERLTKVEPSYRQRRIQAIANVGVARMAEGNIADAEAFLVQALNEWKKIRDENYRDERDPGFISSDLAIAGVSYELGQLHARMNNLSSAEADYDQAIGIYRKYPADAVMDMRDFAEAIIGAARIYRSTNRPLPTGALYLQSAKLYKRLTESSADCHGKYGLGLAESLSGLAWADLKLQRFPDARDAAIASAREYQHLKSLDPGSATEGYANAMLDQLDVLKEAGGDRSVICPIAADITQNKTSALGNRAAAFVQTTCTDNQ